MENFGYYVFCLIAFVVVFFLIKKIAGCMIKTVIMAIVAAILAAVYFLCFKFSDLLILHRNRKTDIAAVANKNSNGETISVFLLSL